MPEDNYNNIPLRKFRAFSRVSLKERERTGLTGIRADGYLQIIRARAA